jgi:predicted nucleic acid-binding protein
MPTGKTPRYCWDSCVFISLLTQADRTAEEIQKLIAVERLSDNGGCVIFTAAITLVEVLSCMLTPEQEQLFQELLQRSNVTAVSITPRIAITAREIRDHYQKQDIKMAVADSIHLATAVHYNATALHTYDGGGQRKRRTDLLNLATPLIEKYAIKIVKPEPPPPETPDVQEAVIRGLFDEPPQEAEQPAQLALPAGEGEG